MCPLLGGSLTKIVTFGTKPFVHYSRHVRYLGCPLLGGFTISSYLCYLQSVAEEVNMNDVNITLDIGAAINASKVILNNIDRLDSFTS